MFIICYDKCCLQRMLVAYPQPISFLFPVLNPLVLVLLQGNFLRSGNLRWIFPPALGMNHDYLNPTIFCQLSAFPVSLEAQGDPSSR